MTPTPGENKSAEPVGSERKAAKCSSSASDNGGSPASTYASVPSEGPGLAWVAWAASGSRGI